MDRHGSSGGRGRGGDGVGTYGRSRCSTGDMGTAHDRGHALLLLRPAPPGSKDTDHGILGDLHRLHRGMDEAGRGGSGLLLLLLRRRLGVGRRRNAGGHPRRHGRRGCGGRWHHLMMMGMTRRRTMV